MGRRFGLSGFGCVLMLIACVIGGWFLFGEMPRMHATQGSEGRTAQGVLVEKFEEDTGKAHAFKARIRFQDSQGREHEIVDDFDNVRWQNLNQGEPMPIRYIAADPDYAYALNSLKGRRNPAVVLLACAGMFGFGLLLVIFDRFVRTR